MDPFEQELRDALGAAEPPSRGREDLAGTAVRVHRRRRAVRSVAVAATTLAVVGAVGLGVGVTAGGRGDRPVPPASVTEQPAPTPTGAPTTPSQSPTPTTPTTTAPVVDQATSLLVTSGQQVTLFRLPPGSDEVVPERVLTPPATPSGGAFPWSTTLSSGEDPVACVAWQLGPVVDVDPTEVACYASGSAEPVTVALPEGFVPRDVALRADGSEIAVVGRSPEGSGTVAVSRLDDLTSTGWRTWPSGTSPEDESRSVSVAFAGTSDLLLVSSENTAPQSTGLVVLDLTAAGRAWDVLDRLAPATGGGHLGRPAGVDGTTALVQLDDSVEDGAAAVAALVDLRDGRVLRTVGSPDRDVLAVSGTPQVLLYSVRDRAAGQPSSDEGVMHLVLREGQAEGVPLRGLPDDPHLQVVAGPAAP
jgi:hypothetical protein